jgi:hypothetical protein
MNSDCIAHKKARVGGLFYSALDQLLDLGFFVHHVFLHLRIVLLHFHFVGMKTLVLGSGVVVASASRRNQFDFVAHVGSLTSDLHAIGTQFCDDYINAFLFDGTKPGVRNAQADITTLTLHPETLLMQVRQKAAPTPVVGVGNGVTGQGCLTGDLANSRHGNFLGCQDSPRQN